MLSRWPGAQQVSEICYTTPMASSENLVESALEFLETSCDQYGGSRLPDRRGLKHSTLSLCIGIELFLKARLADEHWTLILQNVDRYREGDRDRGSFQSIGLRDSIARLLEVCRLSISQEAENAFANLADLRNKFMHFGCTDSAERVTGIQLRAWHYFMDLFGHDFMELSEEHARALQAIKTRMLRRDEFLASRFEEVRASIEQRAQAGAKIISCPFCSHAALSVGDGATCLVCGSGGSDARVYAEESARRSAPWMSSDEYYNMQWAAICSDCRERACVSAPGELRSECEEIMLRQEEIRREPGMDLDPWYCFNCGAVYDSFDIVECTRCGNLFARAGDESLCPRCSW